MKKAKVKMVCALAFMCGCTESASAAELTVVYDSYPSGAMLCECGGNGETNCLGTGPYTVRYTVREAQAVFICAPVMALWVSGAETVIQVRHNLSQGYSTFRTLTRPADAPNLDMDVSYALKRERTERERRKEAFEQEQMRGQAQSNQEAHLCADRAAEKRHQQDRMDQALQNLNTLLRRSNQ